MVLSFKVVFRHDSQIEKKRRAVESSYDTRCPTPPFTAIPDAQQGSLPLAICDILDAHLLAVFFGSACYFRGANGRKTQLLHRSEFQ
jgi:hypothetical protein